MLHNLRKIIQAVSAAEDLPSALKLVVHQVRRAMRTDVCSIYLHFPQTDNFVLMATKGLNQASIGKACLPSGKGLVGLVGLKAETINITRAAEHPNFHYVQETGEEGFSSFLGVPIIHHRKVLGILVVQQRSERQFSAEEEAMLITLSAQLAGFIAHAEATGGGLRQDALADEASLDLAYEGVSGSGGVAIGYVAVIAPPADLDKVPDRRCRNPENEVEAFQTALEAVRRKIKIVSRTLARNLKNQEQELFEVYMRMLDDNALAGEVVQKIRQGQWAQGALRQVVQTHIGAFEAMDDPYLRERATDIRDLGRRILAELQQTNIQVREFEDATVLVAEEVTATMLAEVPAHKLKAIISTLGSNNSHAAILARSMGIPTVMGAVDFPCRRMEGQEVVIDGYIGRIFLNPSQDLRRQYEQTIAEEASFTKELEILRHVPAQTRDGHTVPLLVNTSLPLDVSRSLDQGAEGVGLYRTEVPFMIKEHFPSEDEQTDCYRTQLQGFAPLPVTMRTLDIGGDKNLPYFAIKEDNPFLGWRGIRVTLDHPEIFLVQIRAMLKASEGIDNLRIMLPMITHVSEVDESIRWIDQAFSELCEEGYKLVRPPIGVMVEVPAAVYQAKHIAERVDFISVGSNDLTQYILAVDRDNPRVADLYHTMHPAVLMALQHVVDAAKAADIPVSLCGELAGDPAGALLLMGMGYDSLSMNAASLPKVKSVIRNFTLTQAQQMLQQALQQAGSDGVQQVIRDNLKAAGLTRLHSRYVGN
ncbi:MAG: phosphotransferase system enzyme I (PtsP) [Oceanospirillaceae bacterium]|jgi:phosphotransferase system enzyme I (PtsP)